jgi:hypothetical protein
MAGAVVAAACTPEARQQQTQMTAAASACTRAVAPPAAAAAAHYQVSALQFYFQQLFCQRPLVVVFSMIRTKEGFMHHCTVCRAAGRTFELPAKVTSRCQCTAESGLTAAAHLLVCMPVVVDRLQNTVIRAVLPACHMQHGAVLCMGWWFEPYTLCANSSWCVSLLYCGSRR